MLVFVLFSIATITVSAEENHAPVACDDFYSMYANSSLSMLAPGILDNDTDLDGDSLTAVLVSNVCNGSLLLNADGSFIYTPNTGFIGVDVFFYQAYDGINYSNTSIVIIIVNATENCVEDFPMYEDHCGSGWTNHNSPYYHWFGQSGGYWEYHDSVKYYVLRHLYRGYLDGNYQFSGYGSGSEMNYHPTLADGSHSFKVTEYRHFQLYRWKFIFPRWQWVYYGTYYSTYDYSNIITVYIDTTNPTGSISINNGDASTDSTSVTLSLTYSDSMSGVSQVRYSNDGVFDTEPWESPSPTKPWTLTSGYGTKIVWYQIKDNAGNIITYQDDIKLNQPPVADINGPYYVDEGSVIPLIGTGSYDNDGSIVLYEWDLDNDGQYDDATGSTTSFSKPDNSVHQVGLKVTDNDGAISTISTIVTVENVAPTAYAGGDKIGVEPSPFTFTGSHTDPGIIDTHTYQWDFDYHVGLFDVDATGITVSNYWCDDFDGDVALRVTDDDGGIGIDTCSVVVSNVAPTITSLTVTPGLVAVGDSVTLYAPFTDPGCDTWTADIDWENDGTYDDNIDPAVNPITATYSYADTGVYTVKLKVTDDDQGSDTEIFQYVVVYDPNDGFVTGGGWINSPAGAYTADPTLEGTANFGFVSKYKKGQQTPTGNTEFQYQIGNINFHSNSYQWLVIAGHKAMYKGTGTINGDGNYGFMISAIDEKLTPSTDVDLFRIKIWDKDDGDAIVYDNGLGADEDEDPTTEIAGGQIVIHKK